MPDISWHGALRSSKQTGAVPGTHAQRRVAEDAQDTDLHKPQRLYNRSKPFDLKTVQAFRASTQSESVCRQPNRSVPSSSNHISEIRYSNDVSAAARADIASLSRSLPAHLMPQEATLSQGLVPSSSSASADRFETGSAREEADVPSIPDVLPAEVKLESSVYAEAVLAASVVTAEHGSEAAGSTTLSPVDTLSGNSDMASEQRVQVECTYLEESDQVVGDAELSGSEPVRALIGPPAGQGVSRQANRIAQLQQMRLVADLRPLCKQYGLSTSGIKQIVIERITQYETRMASKQ